MLMIGFRSFSAILLLAMVTTVAAADFRQWLADFQTEAQQQGISSSVLADAFTGVALLPKVIELDRHQPEGTMTFAEYLRRVLPLQRIGEARRRYQENRELLERVATRYGVPARFLVAFWTIESDFGRNQGGFHVIPALATLAYDGRRSTYFRQELLDALKVLQRGDVTASRMVGSWAGAMGQAQFMPSVFLKYGIDEDGDGRRDIWGSRADVFASAANYLKGIGWIEEQTWGREVRLPEGFDVNQLGLDTTRSLQDWFDQDVQWADGAGQTGHELPTLLASLLRPGGAEGRVYAVYGNFHVIRKWNRSNYFATAVGLLADEVAPPSATLPKVPPRTSDKPVRQGQPH